MLRPDHEVEAPAPLQALLFSSSSITSWPQEDLTPLPGESPSLVTSGQRMLQDPGCCCSVEAFRVAHSNHLLARSNPT